VSRQVCTTAAYQYEPRRAVVNAMNVKSYFAEEVTRKTNTPPHRGERAVAEKQRRRGGIADVALTHAASRWLSSPARK